MEHYAIGFKKNPYAKKRVIEGDVVAVLDASIDRRGLKLIIPPTRAVRKNEIHQRYADVDIDMQATFVASNAA